MGKKVIVGAALVVVTAIVLAIAMVASRLGGIAGRIIEDYGSATTGTDVSVRSVDIEPTRGHGEVKHLTIANPPGFATDYALRVDDIELALDLGSLRGAVPVVREVLVDDAHLNAEQRGDTTNLTDIERYMSKAENGSAQPGTPEERVIIDRFRLTHGHVTLTSELLSHPEELELGDVVVENIGRGSGGATYGEATEAVLAPILRAARAAVQARLKDAAATSAREQVEERAAEKLKGLFERD
ncbi:MAG TPA: hypothetical protein VE907_02885 [Gammaproteobacteria bacterium]|nr:hypothetical protein [Gammaproteobacteria bacterium]